MPEIKQLNDSLKKPTPRSKLRGIYGFLPFGTGRRPTRCFLGTLQRAAGNDQVQRVLELSHEEGFRSMKSAALQGQSSLRNAYSVTESVSQDLTLFSRNPALFIDLNPAHTSTVRIDRPA